MKKKNLILKKYLKSKKGFSLLELLCAVMIMAIAVSATAVGLNISNQSITKNSLMNKASAKAQMYCDIIMTYVEKTPSNDPDPLKSWNDIKITSGSKELVLDQNANKLFKNQENKYFMFTDDIQSKINTDVTNLDSEMTAKQYAAADETVEGSIEKRNFNTGEVAYTIEKQGYYYSLDSESDAKTEDKAMASYKITVYIDYGTNGTTSCTGVVTKNKYAAFKE